MKRHASSNEDCDAANAGRLSRRGLLQSAVITTMTVKLGGPLFAQPVRECGTQATRNDVPATAGVKPVLNRLGTAKTDRKLIAQRDYERSLAQFGGRFSSPIRNLFITAQDACHVHFGVVVIGSGYGAAVCAARLSRYLREDYRMCILERGKEWVPGTFPDSSVDVFRNTRNLLAGPQKGQLKNPLGLYDVMMNDEVNVLTGSGLGGGSLINASIALRPHHEVFAQKEWPSALRDVAVLAPYYELMARQMSLTVTPFDQTPKIRARRKAAEKVSTDHGFFDTSNVSVMYDYRYLDDQMRNPQGMIQRPCTLCGDCITGCNIGAKNTLLMNYLPVARQNGVEMYTQCEVQSIEKKDGHYRLNLIYVKESKSGELSRHPVSITARMVVVAGGSPSSAMILLNSQTDHFSFSPALGYNWSGNGDTIGFVIEMPRPTNIGGFGAYGDSSCRQGVGPTVQTSLNFYSNQQLHRRLLIQDAAIPRGVSNLFTVLLNDKSLDHSMVMLGMGHDGGHGRITKIDGRYQIKWPGLRESEYRKMVFAEFERLAAAHGGKYKRLKAFGQNLVTVHPLGGCGMSDDPCYGTTNHLGQVHDGRCLENVDGTPAVHHGLYVADGSVIPTPLGVNPFMTIGAVCERIANHIVANPLHADLFEPRSR